jgi:hypothetical protein
MDRHSALIAQNKAGLLRGADAKRKAGIITPAEKRDIIDMVNLADLDLFQPLIFVIPCTPAIRKVAQVVPHTGRANPLYEEYVISELSREDFDVIDPNP